MSLPTPRPWRRRRLLSKPERHISGLGKRLRVYNVRLRLYFHVQELLDPARLTELTPVSWARVQATRACSSFLIGPRYPKSDAAELPHRGAPRIGDDDYDARGSLTSRIDWICEPSIRAWSPEFSLLLQAVRGRTLGRSRHRVVAQSLLMTALSRSFDSGGSPAAILAGSVSPRCQLPRQCSPITQPVIR